MIKWKKKISVVLGMDGQHTLQSIHVSGFRSIQSVDLPIQDLNILIGQNGAGKSNFIELFRFLHEIINQRLQVYTAVKGGADKLLHYGSRETKQIKIILTFNDSWYELSLIIAQDDRLIIEFEETNVITGPITTEGVRFSKGKEESLLTKNSFKVSQVISAQLKNWRVYHFHDTSAEAPVKKLSDISDTAFLRADAGNLAAFLWYMQQKSPKHYERIVSTIKLVLPFFGDFIFRPNPYNEQKILLEWQDNRSDMRFNASDLSDGSLRFICLVTLLLQPKLPNLILLDEPELGLHPTALALLAGLLKKASSRTQVIVSTQSVNLVNAFAPDDVIVVDREDADGRPGHSTFRRLETDVLATWLTEYSLGDLWEKNVIGGTP
ncbi:AAA family ATPase [Spirosoma linguale]|uniref:SMC domain protein n=1 Tax=Spirosoma linguale (strain ATCC 33905 / DSM 74 / LMG 10896 / Claus 1) TaxID=504472 RepID=D2QNQ5_SPILD|nr:SMC domain protein [Spirosoma linguale DSM 74]